MLWDAAWKIDAEYCDRNPDGTVIFLEDPAYRNHYYTITLTAKWTAEAKKAGVWYDLNGGTGTVADDAVYSPNDRIQIPSAAPVPPTNQRFLGWLDATGNLYQPGGEAVYSGEELLSQRDGEDWLVLTAQYEPIPEPAYSSITFRTNGGAMVPSITLKPGETVTPPENPVRTGYTFSGWSPALPKTMPPESLTVDAVWTANRYTITFDTGRGSVVTPVTQEYSAPVNAPGDPVLTGYTFVAWDPVLPETMPAQDLSVKAVWLVNSYTLTFDTDGGSAVERVTDIYGALITPPAHPVKDGYVFDGWDRAVPQTMPAENLTITAKWRQDADEPGTDGPGNDAPGTETPAVTASDYSGVYDGQSHSITVSAPAGAVVTYSDTPDGTYRRENPAYKDAGEYTVYYQVTAEGAAPVTGSANVSIAKRAVTISGITALSRSYNGGTDAALDVSGAVFDGLISGDRLTVTGTGAFEDPEAGTDKTVRISGLTLGGPDAGNYTLAAAGQQTETKADITAAASGWSTEIYTVKQNGDGTWAAPALVETTGGSAVQAMELYRGEYLHLVSYSVRAAAQEGDRTPISAGDSVGLADAGGALYLYYARDAFPLTYYADGAGTKVLKTEQVLYGADLSSYGNLTLENTDLITFGGWSPDKDVTVYLDRNGQPAREIDWDHLTMPAEPLDAYPCCWPTRST